MTDDAEARALVRVEFPAGDPPRDGVALVTLDRPEALNALSFDLLEELDGILAVLDDDDACRAIVITGAGERAFAAGADIRELASSVREDLHADNPFAAIDRLGRLRTPTIAAVRGFALGGGAELAMACDMLIAAEDAQLGQPEIRIGVIPGAGGTQRLTRADRPRTGDGARPHRPSDRRRRGGRDGPRDRHRAGSPRRSTGPSSWRRRSRRCRALAVRAAKAAVNATQQLSLDEGLRFERDRFEALFETEDQREGMVAFLEKRAPAWKGR